MHELTFLLSCLFLGIGGIALNYYWWRTEKIFLYPFNAGWAAAWIFFWVIPEIYKLVESTPTP